MTKNKTILVVDDSADSLTLLGRILTQAGYSVLKAETGKEGLLKAKSGRPALILLDVDLPDMDGGKVAEVLADDPATRAIPVIFVTGLMLEGEAGYPAAGKDHYIAKPFDTSDLLRAIETRLK